MGTVINVLAGGAGLGKTGTLLKRYREALRAGHAARQPGRTLWLAPTHRSAQAIREQLVDGSFPAVFSPHVVTFDDFARRVLQTVPEPVAPLSPVMKRTLLRRIVARHLEARRLRHFANISQTSGFIDLLAGFISEMKRGEIWPERFEEICSHGGRLPLRDKELAGLYREYQDLLLREKLYDAEGRFWSAREALKAGYWGPFGNVSLVVVDGFTDFMYTQYEILQHLTRRADELWLSLPLEFDGRRADLFAKTGDVYGRVQKFAEVQVVNAEGRQFAAERQGNEATAGDLPGGLQHVAKHLFCNPREIVPGTNGTGIELVTVAGQQGEVRMLASRIKQLLLDGVPPGDIVVALRGLDDYADLLESTFRASHIPFASEAGRPLSRSPVLRAVLSALRLETEGWSFRRLMGLLNSNFFNPAWPEFREGGAKGETAAVLRRMKLDADREQMLYGLLRERQNNERVQAAAMSPRDDGSPATPLTQTVLDWHAAVSHATAFLERLSTEMARLRGKATFAQWAERVVSLSRVLGLRPPEPLVDVDGTAVGEPIIIKDDATDDPDARSWELFERLLFDAARAERHLLEPPAEMTLDGFVHELTDLLKTERLGSRVREEGRVRILDAPQVRNLNVPYLFLAGLTERSFPGHSGDDCLFSDAERRRLFDLGLTIGHRASHQQEELLLFYGVVTRARKLLVLSYPAVSTDGHPLTASPYLVALKSLFAKGVLTESLDEHLSPVPERTHVLTEADARVRAVHEALEGKPVLCVSLCQREPSQTAVVNALSAVDMAVSRFHSPGFHQYEGWLQNARNLSQIARWFARQHEFSATQLEAYAQCPFKFMMANVLKIDEQESEEVETDVGLRGTMVHAVLSDLHSQWTATPGPPTGDELATRFCELMAARLKRQPNRSDLQAALLEIERRLLNEWAVQYGEQWDDYRSDMGALCDRPPLPKVLETTFGTPRHEAAVLTPLAAGGLTFGAGDDEVRVGGRIDRIDVGTKLGRPVFTVIDYKTGKPPAFHPEQVESGNSLQLPLYTLAVQKLQLAGTEAEPLQMAYWGLKESGFAPGLKGREAAKGLDEEMWERLQRSLEKIIPRLAAGIRQSQFPVYNPDIHCTARCAYKSVCRIGQIRALPARLEKTWRPPLPASEPTGLPDAADFGEAPF